MGIEVVWVFREDGEEYNAQYDVFNLGWKEGEVGVVPGKVGGRG